MHEMGIANSILEAAWEEARRYPGGRPAKVGVVIGEFAGVDTESLRFCFEAITKDRKPAPIELDIAWRAGSDELKFAYLELDEVGPDEVGPNEVRNDASGNREEGSERERLDCGAAA